MTSALRRPALPCLLILLALLGCGRQSAARDAEVQALRERVELLEREANQNREQLAADVAALRASLDEANRQLAELSGQDPAAAKTAQPGKSPRAALRESLRGVMDMSRQALDRLNQGLDKSLHRSQNAEPAADPAK